MKNRLIAFTLAALLLASCGTVSITKRYHRGGFQIEFNKGGDDAQVARVSKKAKPGTAGKAEDSRVTAGVQDAAMTDESVVAAPAEYTFNADEAQPEKTLQAVASGEKFKAMADKAAKKEVKHSRIGMIKKAAELRQAVKEANRPADAPDSTLMWIIYLILCFIIPPLAYYLITRETDTLFWICLICFLLAGGVFLVGVSFGGLLGLVSVVIALLALLGS